MRIHASSGKCGWSTLSISKQHNTKEFESGRWAELFWHIPSYSQNITILNCIVYSSGTGISICHSSYCRIYGNVIERNGIGLSITGSEVGSTGHHNLIYNNTVAFNSDYGMYLGGYCKSVYRNNITGNDRGINAAGFLIDIYENTVTRNMYPHGEGISVGTGKGGCNEAVNGIKG